VVGALGGAAASCLDWIRVERRRVLEMSSSFTDFVATAAVCICWATWFVGLSDPGVVPVMLSGVVRTELLESSCAVSVVEPAKVAVEDASEDDGWRSIGIEVNVSSNPGNDELRRGGDHSPTATVSGSIFDCLSSWNQ
jgi:hypothetical protein